MGAAQLRDYVKDLRRERNRRYATKKLKSPRVKKGVFLMQKAFGSTEKRFYVKCFFKLAF